MLAIYLILAAVICFFTGIEGFLFMLFCGLLIFSRSFRHFVGNVATIMDLIGIICDIFSLLG